MKVVGNLVGCHSCAQLTAKVVESDAQMKLCTHTHNLPHTPSHFTHILSLRSSHHTPRTSPHTLTPSSTLCDKYLQLLFTVLEKSPEPTIRANTIIAAGDLTFRYPNLIEPWTPYLYAR